MKRTKTVGIKDLKNNLSAHLREVRTGITVLVSDRNNIVAEIQDPHSRVDAAVGPNSLPLPWVREGTVSLPKAEKLPLQPSPVSLSSEVADRILEEDRKGSGY